MVQFCQQLIKNYKLKQIKSINYSLFNNKYIATSVNHLWLPLVDMIRVLYNNVSSCVMNNGFSTAPCIG